MKSKKFAPEHKSEVVSKEDIIKPGDWALTWNPNTDPQTTGFNLFTPPDFDPDNGGPLGGLILAAVFFLVEHGDPSFHRELVEKANRLSAEMTKNKQQPTTKKILN